MNKAKRYLTTGEAAQLCGVTLRTIINWIKKGRLKAHQLPGTRKDNRIAPQDLALFMRENNLPVPAELSHYATEAKVLVVDDDPLMAKAITRVLKEEGYEVHIAHDGFAAGCLFQQLKPELMTLDLQMPRLDGFALLKQLQNRTGTKILVLSAMEGRYLKQALDLGADDVLAKPFENTDLIEKVFTLLH